MHSCEAEKLHPSSEDRGVDLRARGFTTEMAAELRQRLLTFEEDWNAPEMEAYDEFEAQSSKLKG